MGNDDSHRLHAELKELGVKIDNLTGLFNRAAYGDGFTRCANHGNRLQHLEEDVELCHQRISGVKKWLIAGLVSLISMLANFVWSVLQTSLKGGG